MIGKEIKKTSMKSFKKNYWRSVAIAFFVALMLGNLKMNTPVVIHDNISNITSTHMPVLSSINSEIFKETVERITNIKTNITSYKPTRGILANIFNNVTSSNNFFFGILNSLNQLLFHEHLWASLIILLGAILSLLYWYFFQNVLIVGNARFFLENRNYPETNFKRVLLPFKIKKIRKISYTMFIKTIKELLWWFTIIGGFIKHYAYALVPFILAENPEIKASDAIKLSESMMQGHKWELFKIDLSFILLQILDLFTFHLIGIIIINPYKSCCRAEFYMQTRTLAKNKKITNSEQLKDTYLEQVGEIYPKENYLYPEINHKWLNTDFNRNYSVISLILMFFTASIIGWIWEVGLHLFQYGSFVNRGTLHGPWLPIYGWGVVILLVVLKKFRNHPILTFLLAIILCGAVEYGTSWYLEITKGMRYWDYDGFFLNLHGRICLEGLMAFGIGGCAFIYFGAPFFDSIYENINPNIKLLFCILFITFFVIDNLYSSKFPNSGEGVSNELKTQENLIITVT